MSVLAPADEDSDLPPYVVAAGRAIPVPYNGAVARLSFGPVSANRVRRWVRDGDFDVLHVHEPVAPSLSILACWAAIGPIVGTFHVSAERSRALNVDVRDPADRAGEDQRAHRGERVRAQRPWSSTSAATPC